MATTDAELISELRIITGHNAAVLDDTEMASVLSTAKRHIRVKRSITASWNEADWYENENREEALFWFAALFSKVATGELDAQSLQIGAIDEKELLAKGNNDVTTWYRNARSALGGIEPGQGSDAGYGFGISAPEREDRVYGTEDAGSDVTL